MKRLETERLILRKWENSDIEDFFEYASNPLVGPNAGWKPHEDKEETQRVLDIFMSENEALAIVLKEEDKVIGSIGLHNRKPDESITIEAQREIGYVLNPDYWGRGIMPEAVRRVTEYAFEEENMEIVWCCHFDFNNKSKRVIEKCGFNYRGKLEKTLKHFDDKNVTSMQYSITSDEYSSMK